MSDSEGESPTKGDKKSVIFTDKEELVLKAAWRCLKSGPPEVDMEKLQKAANFNTLKTASNTWGKSWVLNVDVCADDANVVFASGVIKKKLFSDVDGGSLPTAPSTPVKPKATPKGKKAATTATPSSKKRAKKDSDDDSEDEGRTLISKRNKSSAAKKAVKTENSDDD
ncbi:hypothetical protein E4T49_05359 [Aureobasidium sp. EXF-10728]|nr:hypothetical protein E4T49_05359 [Aureobasidium sp. EXF-10728]